MFGKRFSLAPRLLQRITKGKLSEAAGAQQVYAGCVLLALLVLAWGWSRLPSRITTLDERDTEVALQVVPSIVIAVLLFGVGITFVVAQVVPAARGTRAAALLTDVRVHLTIGPAIGLLVGVALLLTFHNVRHRDHLFWIDAPAMTFVLIVLTLAYVVVATVSLAGIYRDATNPEDFRSRVTSAIGRKCKAAVDQQTSQEYVDELYGAVRTLRGWARTAAMSGDSRELNEALTGFLDLCTHVAERLPFDGSCELVPQAYSNSSLTNPMRGPKRHSARDLADEYRAWQEPGMWTPDEDVRRPAVAPGSVWFADEVARAIVRVVEIGFEGHTLLDRDLYRLLSSLANAALIFCPEPKANPCLEMNPRQACAGVMIRSLAGAGLAAGSAIDKKPEWFYEPAIQLGRLWKTFDGNSILADGSAAGLVAVLCALEAAFPEHHCLEKSVEAIRREAGELPAIESKKAVRHIARSELFESPHHPRVIDVEKKRYDRAIEIINLSVVSRPYRFPDPCLAPPSSGSS